MPNKNFDNIRIKHKIDTSENWVQSNPVLLKGELAIESDTNKMKIGDGSSTYSNLPYFGGDVRTIFSEPLEYTDSGEDPYWVDPGFYISPYGISGVADTFNTLTYLLKTAPSSNITNGKPLYFVIETDQNNNFYDLHIGMEPTETDYQVIWYNPFAKTEDTLFGQNPTVQTNTVNPANLNPGHYFMNLGNSNLPSTRAGDLIVLPAASGQRPMYLYATNLVGLPREIYYGFRNTAGTTVNWKQLLTEDSTFDDKADYETGTWTPTFPTEIADSISSFNAYYSKNGDQVKIFLSYNIDDVSINYNDTNNFSFGGLPFSASSTRQPSDSGAAGFIIQKDGAILNSYFGYLNNTTLFIGNANGSASSTLSTVKNVIGEPDYSYRVQFTYTV